MSQDNLPQAFAEHTDKPVVEARFHLVEVVSLLAYGDGGYKSGKQVRVKMQAAKSGIFGTASPQGSIEILIANPGAYRIFEAALDDAAKRLYDPEVPGPKMGSKRYRVYIVEDEDQTPA